MYTEVRTSGGITLVPMETRHLSKRRIYLRGRIDMESACAFLDRFLLLQDEDPTEPIDIFISSSGGEIQAGLMIYDLMRTSQVPIRTWCMGTAYSMAAVLFAAGTQGRFMLPHSKLMLHEPLIDRGIGGNVTSFRAVSEELISVRDMLNGILSELTGKTPQEIEKASSYDHYFTAQESIDFGLADRIVGADALTGSL